MAEHEGLKCTIGVAVATHEVQELGVCEVVKRAAIEKPAYLADRSLSFHADHGFGSPGSVRSSVIARPGGDRHEFSGES